MASKLKQNIQLLNALIDNNKYSKDFIFKIIEQVGVPA